ncbi:MAG TPA: hypothetical protein DHU96_09540 [Actinobacteria bacterium]|nr:hypothetical protein [Actinomycetota bacterium]
MSTNVGRHSEADQPSYTPATATPTGWIGWIVFGGVTMIVLGAFQIIEGLVAVFNHGYYLVTSNDLLVHVNYTTWGWVHFGIGVAILLTGFGVMTGAMWARVLGIGFAVISAIVNLAFIAAYPVWGVIVIALDVLVIYALAVHGREMKEVA